MDRHLKEGKPKVPDNAAEFLRQQKERLKLHSPEPKHVPFHVADKTAGYMYQKVRRPVPTAFSFWLQRFVLNCSPQARCKLQVNTATMAQCIAKKWDGQCTLSDTLPFSANYTRTRTHPRQHATKPEYLGLQWKDMLRPDPEFRRSYVAWTTGSLPDGLVELRTVIICDQHLWRSSVP